MSKFHRKDTLSRAKLKRVAFNFLVVNTERECYSLLRLNNMCILDVMFSDTNTKQLFRYYE